ncbi:MAG: Hsp70 family protein [Clostridia bacterium]|nr:Hsp70 family protein [Clostridia bacterium]
MRYIGFDIGDGESAVAAFEQGSGIEPIIMPVAGCGSVLSAVGFIGNEIVIGDRAYTDELADGLSVRFKSRFTFDTTVNNDIISFVKGILRDLQQNDLLKPDDRFVIGCPAGWSSATRSRYRDLMISAGIANPQVISESRAAFLYAKYAKTVALDVDILNESALVIDIGSSTLDFAYIVDGRETGVGTFGEIALGGGLLDAEFLRLAVEQSRDKEAIRQVFAESKSWNSYCELEARRLKEAYYTRLSKDPSACIKKQLRICYDGIQKLNLHLDSAQADKIINSPLAVLGGRSFVQGIQDALDNAVRLTVDRPPRLLLLTGGASRMPFFRQACKDAFPDAVVVCCPEPEYSIAKGLAYAGWIDENLRSFRQAIDKEISDERVSHVVHQAIPDLMPGVVDALVDLLMDEAALPIYRDWQSGKLLTLSDMNDRMQQRMADVLDSPLTEEALAPTIHQWLKKLTPKLQNMVDPICDRYEVPRKEMQLNLTASGSSQVSFSAKELMRFPFIGTILGLIVSVVVGFLCGGSGLALIATGPLGFLAGAVIGAIMTLFGWNALSGALMKANLPLLMRRMGNEKKLSGEATRQKLREAITKELFQEDGKFMQQITSGFSYSFRKYLKEIAQAAEIPIE